MKANFYVDIARKMARSKEPSVTFVQTIRRHWFATFDEAERFRRLHLGGQADTGRVSPVREAEGLTHATRPAVAVHIKPLRRATLNDLRPKVPA